MLTDIFAVRYSDVPLWSTFEEPQRRLLVQGFRILSEQICPYYSDGNESARGKAFWTDIHNRLSMELGLKSLSPLTYSYQSTYNGKPHTVAGTWSIHKVCETWLLSEVDGSISADQFMKERLSLIEIGFRKRGGEIAHQNQQLPIRVAETEIQGKRIQRSFHVPGNLTDGMKAANKIVNQQFDDSVNELNTRFRQAGANLNYHNGFIQLADDELAQQQIQLPFWALVADPKWQNVDTDMKEAVDRRDTRGRDPAFYAARALESAIKIVSDEKGWTHGRERGAHNFIDNLASKRAAFINDWEATALKNFFTNVRNPFGHGPGNDAMPTLTPQQTDWAIETCMCWIKNIIKRLST